MLHGCQTVLFLHCLSQQHLSVQVPVTVVVPQGLWDEPRQLQVLDSFLTEPQGWTAAAPSSCPDPSRENRRHWNKASKCKSRWKHLKVTSLFSCLHYSGKQKEAFSRYSCYHCCYHFFSSSSSWWIYSDYAYENFFKKSSIVLEGRGQDNICLSYFILYLPV